MKQASVVFVTGGGRVPVDSCPNKIPFLNFLKLYSPIALSVGILYHLHCKFVEIVRLVAWEEDSNFTSAGV